LPCAPAATAKYAWCRRATPRLASTSTASPDAWTPIHDRYVEGLTKSIMESAERSLVNPRDYQARATFMWCATLAWNGLGLAGLGAGVRFVMQEGLANIREKEERLTKLLMDGLATIPGVDTYGNSRPGDRVAIVSFNISGLTPSEVALQLEEDFRIMCRPGLHCSPTAHKTLGTFPQGSVRLSPGHFNSVHDIERTVEAVRQIARKAR
jgi:selenocysteine lyase/cysteine desulfurase